MKKILLALFLGLSAACAQSSTVVFDGVVGGSFSSVVAGSGDKYGIFNNDNTLTLDATSGHAVFAWGTSSYYYPAIDGNSSSFSFQGVGSDVSSAGGFSVTAGDQFLLGDFTYHNTPVYYAGGVTGVTFDVGIDFLDPALGSSLFSVNLAIDNTPNTGGTNVPDIVSIAGMSTSNTAFSFGGHDYVLQILGFSRDGGVTFETGTAANENEATTAGIYAVVNDVTVVPVPAALWLFGSGLMGLLGVARRTRTS